MGDNVDQNQISYKEVLLRLEIIELKLELRNLKQQQKAPKPPSLGVWNRPDMFYRDHQNLYHDRDYYEEPRDQYYQEPLTELRTMMLQVIEIQEESIANADRVLRQNELKTMMSHALEIQAKSDARMDSRFNELDSKLDTLSSHVKKLDTQIALTTEHVDKFPGIFEDNPRVEHVEAISLRSDSLQPYHENTLETTEVSNLIISDSSTNSSSFAETGSTEAPVRRSIFKRSVLRSEPYLPKPGERVYIPRIPYPDAVYKPNISEKLVPSVAICSNVKAWSPEPTRHTMPWFEEIDSYQEAKLLTCV